MKRINLPTLSTSFVLALVLALGSAPNAASQPTVGSCDDGGAQGTFDGNRIQATVFSVGSMFFGPAGFFGLNVDEASAVFASSVWIGGRVNGDLRIAAATYGQGNASASDFEFWPGPLNDQGQLPNPNDCSQYDRIWKVNRQDIADYNAGGAPATDLEEWPWDLGAPVIDGDGNPDNYNLEGGDRPDIIGDQALWWVMNDVGNVKNSTLTEPLGIELRMHMFGFERDNPLGTTTFYKATVINKWNETIEDTRITIFVDPDLGSATDDFVGSDTTLSMGFVYNADNNDDGGYGLTPPALGYDFFQGPLVDAPGERWEDPCYDPDLSDAQNQANGCLHLDQRRLGMTVFNYFNNDGSAQGNPNNGTQYWNYMNGAWKEGDPLVTCGTGFGCGGEETNFAYPGDPVAGEFWSEENIDEAGTRNPASDRRFMVTTGPFDMEAGETQEIVFGIVYARGVNRLSSVAALRAADIFAQNAFDLDFDLPVPASAPPQCDPNNPNRLPGSGTCFMASELDAALNLSWGYASTDPGFLGNYESKGYQFEGFKVYEYPNSNFSAADRELVAIYDKANDITTVQNFVFDPQVGALVPVLAAQGTDSGLNYSLNVTSTAFGEGGTLSNYSDYFFGLTTYMVDETQELERVVESAPTTITLRPANIRNADGGTTLPGEYGAVILPDSSASNFAGGGTLHATVVDPSAVTGDTYAVDFYRPVDNGVEVDTLTAYNITNTTTGEVLFNGQQHFNRTGSGSPELDNAITFDGLSFTILGAEPAMIDIGAIPPGDVFHSAECAIIGSNPAYLIGGNGGDLCILSDLISRLDWQGGVAGITPLDIEIRFVEDPADGQYIFDRTADGTDVNDLLMTGWQTADEGDAACALVNPQVNTVAKLPFTVWEVAPDGSERQVNAAVLDDTGDNIYGCSADQSAYTFGRPTYERIYVNGSSYDEAAIEGDLLAAFTEWAEAEGTSPTLGRLLIAPDGAPFSLPTSGTVIRAVTSKPNLPGDRYVFNTSEMVASRGEGLTQEDVDRIGIVPNPYLGFSAYESANAERTARFTNLPQQATIRIFTISGTLVRTLQKDSPARSFDWNLQTEGGLPVASGLYLVHIELPESGLERVLKFGVVNRKTQLPIL